jgi:hypothetical protein
MIIKIEKYIDHAGKNRKRCLVSCDSCKVEAWRNDYYAVKNLKKHVCRNCNNKVQGSLRLGIPNPSKGKRRKKDSEYILGSVYLNSSGYLEEYVGRSAYKNKKGGYYLQHRKMVENNIGRFLTSQEKVHHIDGEKQHNVLENFYICKNMREHKLIHHSLEKAAFELVKQGLIIFNKQTGLYELPH